ncbi:MAG TPA: PEP-CTERM sorting domain-containing protein [Phycisphaerae bacterium]|nr:PEP-CTERM sorting domain-containing protein [Phycisphaerae bacterium]
MAFRRTTLPACIASVLALAAGQAARADAAPVTIGGATLFQNFFTGGGAAASTNDFIDVDGNGFFGFQPTGVAVQQLAPVTTFIGNGSAVTYAGSTALITQTQQWNVTYRSIGSVNGLQELLNSNAGVANPFGSTPLPQVAGVWINKTQVVTNGVPAFSLSSPNSGNPNAAPISATDIAVMDVTSKWGLQTAGVAAWNRKPTQAGYGTNAVIAAPNGTTGTWTNLLVSRVDNAVTFNNNTGAADSHTLFDTPIAMVPINVIANPGVGSDQIKATELQHLYVTGRLPTGENLDAATRSIGSGTRNAFANSLGMDPSFATGENIGSEQTGDTYTKLGHTYQPTNYSGTGDLEKGVRNNRLAVGYVGTDTAATSANGAGTAYGSMKVAFNVNASANDTNYIAPTLSTIIHNNTTGGWLLAGNETFVTVGDPNATNWAGNTVGNSYAVTANPQMANAQAALYVRNTTESIKNYIAHNATVGSDQFMPGQYLADNFVLRAAPDFVQADNDGSVWVTNTAQVASIRDNDLANSALQAKYGAKLVSDAAVGAGIVPFRNALATGYTDGSTNGNYRYFDSTGTQQTLAGGTALNLRNKIAGDFNNDAARNILDISELVSAANNASAWALAHRNVSAGTTLQEAAIPEILGDFNGDGDFNKADVRYFADGLAKATTGAHAGNIDRKAGFIAVDSNASGNFFATTLKTNKPYAAGDSRGDIAGSIAGPTAGAGPTGWDGAIDAKDLDYTIAQIKKATGQVSVQPTSGSGTVLDVNGSFGTLLTRANANLLIDVRADLSADMNGDLMINKLDLDELAQNVLGTRYGDINLDGRVDDGDLNLLLSNFGHAGTTWAQGNFLGTATTDDGDLNLLLSNFNFNAGFSESLPAAGPIPGGVPEPASLAVIALGSGLLLTRRRTAARRTGFHRTADVPSACGTPRTH